MKILRQYKPWILCGPSDSGRPFAHALVERLEGNAGRLIVADGFVAGVFPVELSDTDIPGLVHKRCLKAARKVAPRWDGEDYALSLDEDVVTLSDKTVMARQNGTFVLPYPRLATIIAKIQDGSVSAIGINGRLHRRMEKAMGWRATLFRMGTSDMPVLCYDEDDNRPLVKPAYPFGIIMPTKPEPFVFPDLHALFPVEGAPESPA